VKNSSRISFNSPYRRTRRKQLLRLAFGDSVGRRDNRAHPPKPVRAVW